MTQLNQQEMERYSRQIRLSEIGQVGQEKLRAARVLLVGVGGLGSPALMYLAGCGIGYIRIVDGDTINLSNLHRQVIYRTDEIGEKKAVLAKLRAHGLNPEIEVEAISERLSPENACKMLQNIDIVIDGSDNFETRYLINDVCVEQDKVFVSASLSFFSGQLSVFNRLRLDGSRGPTYRCLYEEPPAPDDCGSCADDGILGVLPGILGCLQANECLKLILEIGEPLCGKLLILNALDLSTNLIRFQRREEIVNNTRLGNADYYRNLSCSAQDISSRIEISPAELRKLLNTDAKLSLLDVREDFERQAMSIGGAHIPLGKLQGSLESCSWEGPLVVYCEAGIRSLKACRIIKERFPELKVYSLSGGIRGLENSPITQRNI